MKKLCLVLLFLAVLPVFGENVRVEPDRKNYVMGETFRITIVWNGTDERYVISLGPHLRVIGAEYIVEEQRIIRPVNSQNISGVVNRADPIQRWIIQVETWNSSSIFTPSYYDIGFVNMTTAELSSKVHKEIVIVNMDMLLKDYNDKKTELQGYMGREKNYQNMISYLQGQLREAERGMELYKFMSEYGRTFNRYFDYVKFVNKSASELMPLTNIQMTITLPIYYDPYEEKWFSPQLSDIMIKEGVVMVRVPWRTAYMGNESWVPVDSLMDPQNYFNQVAWNLWFSKRMADSREHYKQAYTMSWVVPFGAVGAIALFFTVIGLIFYSIWRKWKRDMESRPVIPPI